VTVQARDAQVEPLATGLQPRKVLVPDPKLAAGPPVFVRLLEPLPSPAFMPYRYVTARRAPSVRLGW